MFSIGLFSTYLPYVILAMFYGLYVGVHSIMKLEQDSDTDEDLAANMIFSDHDDTRQGNVSNTYYYDQFTAENNDCSDPEVHRIAGGTVMPIPHEDPVRRSYYHPLFSRPPPLFSL
jgi:hypothetical protein